MRTPTPRSVSLPRRLAGRTLPSLLRYKFLHEYGYDKGAVVVAAIVDDICQVVRNYYTRPGDLEAGQLVYHAPAVTERARRAKTIGHTKLVPVRLTIVADEDVVWLEVPMDEPGGVRCGQSAPRIHERVHDLAPAALARTEPL